MREADAVRRSIGVALQEAAIDPLMTGRELLRMQGALHGLRGRASARARAVELLERVGLTQAADRRVGGYSGGMRRRLDLALALVHRPQRALPRRADDRAWTRRAARALWREVRALNDEGTTVFLTTQYLEEAEQLADRVGIIAAGTLVAEGTPGALKARVGRADAARRAGRRRGRAGAPARRSPALGELEPPAPSAPRRVALRAAAGKARDRARRSARSTSADVEVESVEVETPTLDDVFARGHRLAPGGRRGEPEPEAVDAA